MALFYPNHGSLVMISIRGLVGEWSQNSKSWSSHSLLRLCVPPPTAHLSLPLAKGLWQRRTTLVSFLSLISCSLKRMSSRRMSVLAMMQCSDHQTLIQHKLFSVPTMSSTCIEITRHNQDIICYSWHTV